MGRYVVLSLGEVVVMAEPTTRFNDGREHGRPLRILMVVDGRYPTTGGAEMQARLLSSAFAKAGHSVRVLTPRLEASQPLHERIDGIEVERIAYPRMRGLGAIILNLRFAAYLWRRRRALDVVHIHMMHNLAGAAGWTKPWIRLPIFVKVSGAAEFQGGILDPALRRGLVHRVLDAGSRRLDGFQCISTFTRQVMLQAGYPAAKLHFIPNAVDCDRFTPMSSAPEQGSRERAPRVVFVGRHVAVKGLDILLRAWAGMTRPAAARLILAGDGPERATLMQQATALGVADSIEFPGTVSDVSALLASASIYVQASHREGLPNSVLEAMAAGLPVVATRIGGHEDIITDGETGVLVAPADPQALAAALQGLLDDLERRQRLGQHAADYVRVHYATAVVIERLLDLYRGHAASPNH